MQFGKRLSTTEKSVLLGALKGQARNLFGNRCIQCLRPTTVVHEIYPISGGIAAYQLNNMVTLCSFCHTWLHFNRSARSLEHYLTERRQWFLERFTGINSYDA